MTEKEDYVNKAIKSKIQNLSPDEKKNMVTNGSLKLTIDLPMDVQLRNAFGPGARITTYPKGTLRNKLGSDKVRVMKQDVVKVKKVNVDIPINEVPPKRLKKDVSNPLSCQHCSKVLKSKSGKISHEKACKSRL